MMTSRLGALILALASLTLLLPRDAWAYQEFTTPGGGNVQGGVQMTTNAAGQAVPTGPTSPLTISPPLVTYSAPVSGTVGASSTTILATPGTRSNIICNISGGAAITLDLSGGAVTNGIGVPIQVGQCLFLGGLTRAVTAVSASGIENYITQVGN